MSKLVLNIERIGVQAAGAQSGHDGRKTGDLTHVDSDQSFRNKVLAGSGDCRKDCQAVIDQHQATVPKNNEKPFTRLLLSASPEHFQDEDGNQDAGKVGLWRRKTMKFLQDEFGDGLAYAVLHRDETTPHIHAVVVPLAEKKTKRKTGWTVSHHKHPSFAGFNSFEKFRQKTADSLGLEYGEPGNKPRTKKQREAEEQAVGQSEALKEKEKALEAEKESLFKIARDQFETAKGLSAEYAAALKADAKALGRALHFPVYDQDPTTPEAREAVAAARARRAEQKQKEGEKQTQKRPVQEPQKRGFLGRRGDSR